MLDEQKGNYDEPMFVNFHYPVGLSAWELSPGHWALHVNPFGRRMVWFHPPGELFKHVVIGSYRWWWVNAGLVN